MKKYKETTIKINERSIDSIKKAERKKAQLENQGYNLVSHFGGFSESVMIYRLYI
jgi:cytolysin (calcineurin-like family phosphatase)